MAVKNTLKEFISALTDEEGNPLTPYKFCQQTGVSQTTIYALLGNDKQLPAPSVIRKVCERYKVQPGLLMRYEEV